MKLFLGDEATHPCYKIIACFTEITFEYHLWSSYMSALPCNIFENSINTLENSQHSERGVLKNPHHHQMTLDKPSNKELLIVIETACSTMCGSLIEIFYSTTSSSLYNAIHSYQSPFSLPNPQYRHIMNPSWWWENRHWFSNEAIDSMGSSDAIWWYKFASKLAQVMTYCRQAMRSVLWYSHENNSHELLLCLVYTIYSEVIYIYSIYSYKKRTIQWVQYNVRCSTKEKSNVKVVLHLSYDIVRRSQEQRNPQEDPPLSSPGTMKLTFNPSSEDPGSHPDDPRFRY